MDFKLGQHDSLKIVSSIYDFDRDGDAELLERNMIEFMIANRGIGLAANQIGLTKRIFVMGSETHTDFPLPFAIFNPVITETSKEMILDQEGCLSYPGIWLQIKRPKWIVASYQDSQENHKEIKLDDYPSKCFQHELDHLDGVCFVDKVSKLKLNLAYKKARKYNDRT
jgi:peptide deformylase